MNMVPVAALGRWVVVGFFLGAAGLSYVYFKNGMQTTGTEIRNMESQLATLQTEDDIERAQIDRLTSQAYLEKRLAEGFIKLTPITDDRIERIHLPGSRPGAATAATDGGDDYQPVSNRLTAQ
jgi:hypothetical protein